MDAEQTATTDNPASQAPGMVVVQEFTTVKQPEQSAGGQMPMKKVAVVAGVALILVAAAIGVGLYQTPEEVPLPPPSPPSTASGAPSTTRASGADCPNLLDPEKGMLDFTDDLSTGSVATLSCSPYPPECVHCVTHSCGEGEIEVLADASTINEFIPVGCPHCQCQADPDGSIARRRPAYFVGNMPPLECRDGVWMGAYDLPSDPPYDFEQTPITCQATEPCSNLLDPDFGMFDMSQDNEHGSIASLTCSPYPAGCVHCVTHTCPEGQTEVLKTAETATEFMPIGCPTCQCERASGAGAVQTTYFNPSAATLECSVVPFAGMRWVDKSAPRCSTTEGFEELGCPEGLQCLITDTPNGQPNAGVCGVGDAGPVCQATEPCNNLLDPDFGMFDLSQDNDAGSIASLTCSPYPAGCVHCVTHTCPEGQTEVLKTAETATATMPIGCPTCQCERARGAVVQPTYFEPSAATLECSAVRFAGMRWVDKSAPRCSTAEGFEVGCPEGLQCLITDDGRPNSGVCGVGDAGPVCRATEPCSNLLDPDFGFFEMSQDNDAGSIATLTCWPYPASCVHCVTHTCPEGQVEVVTTAETATDIMPIGCPMCQCTRDTGEVRPAYFEPSAATLECSAVRFAGMTWVDKSSPPCSTAEGFEVGCPEGLQCLITDNGQPNSGVCGVGETVPVCTPLPPRPARDGR